MTIIIRKLQKKDHPQLLNLVRELRKTGERQHISKKLLPLIRYKNPQKQVISDVNRYVNFKPSIATFFVAEENGNLVGYILGNINKRSGRVFDKIGFIEDWFVKEEHRRKKVGEKLWKELIAWFRRKKCNGLELQAFTNNQNAIEIYHKFGFINKTLTLMKKL